MGSSRLLGRLWTGTRYRLLTVILVVGYLIIIAVLIAAILGKGRAAQYRVSAVTEYFTLVTQRQLQIGKTQVDFDLDGRRKACQAELTIPAGATMTGALWARSQVHPGVHPTHVDISSSSSTKIGVKCEGSSPLQSSGVTLRWRDAPRDESTPGNEKAKGGGQERSADKSDDGLEDRLTFRFNGGLTLGHPIQVNSPTDHVPLLRSAQVVAEYREWPSGNLNALFERSIGEGGQLAFTSTSGTEADVEGQISIRPTAFSLSFRFEGREILSTPPGAADGASVAVAPTFLDRVKTQAEWGAWALVVSLVLALIEVLRSYESAPDSARKKGGGP